MKRCATCALLVIFSFAAAAASATTNGDVCAESGKRAASLEAPLKTDDGRRGGSGYSAARETESAYEPPAEEEDVGQDSDEDDANDSEADAEDARQRLRQHGDGKDGVLKAWTADGQWWYPLGSEKDAARPAAEHIEGRKHGDGRAPIKLVVKRFPLPGLKSENPPKMRGVFVADDSPNGFKEGDLVGCYAGPLVDADAREAKRKVAPHMETYLFTWNETHLVDPTSDTGEIADTDTQCKTCCNTGRGDHQGPCPPFAQEMPLVNEASRGLLPNIFVSDGGRCRDRYGYLGIPYIATRDILPGEQCMVCYGHNYGHRDYESVCSDPKFDDFLGTTTLGKLMEIWGEFQPQPQTAARQEADVSDEERKQTITLTTGSSYRRAMKKHSDCLLVMYYSEDREAPPGSPSCRLCNTISPAFLRAGAMLKKAGICRTARLNTETWAGTVSSEEPSETVVDDLPDLRVYRNGKLVTTDVLEQMQAFSHEEIYSMARKHIGGPALDSSEPPQGKHVDEEALTEKPEAVEEDKQPDDKMEESTASSGWFAWGETKRPASPEPQAEETSGLPKTMAAMMRLAGIDAAKAKLFDAAEIGVELLLEMGNDELKDLQGITLKDRLKLKKALKPFR